MKKIAIFASGNGTNAENIIKRLKYGAASLLVSDNPDAPVLEKVSRLGVETAVFTKKELADNPGRLARILENRAIDYIVLAGFLSFVPEAVTDLYKGRIVNIHPSLLPKFGGKGMYGDRVHRAVIEAGETVSGITVHHVDGIYDNGGIIMQKTVSVTPDDTAESLAAKVHELEYKYYPEAIDNEISKIRYDMNLLLISNSTNPGEEFLGYPRKQLQEFCGKFNVKKAAFVPYAAVTYPYDEFEAKVQKRFAEFGVEIESVHRSSDPAALVRSAECIIVGGGNTFMLVKMMQEQGLIGAIRSRVLEGTPYIGWSAGSNVACPTLCTTNDMPIVQPESFSTLNLIPFQINPHYTDGQIAGHGGETREQRILEYIAANREMYVAGLRERCMFLVEGEKLSLIGPRQLRVFRYGKDPVEFSEGDDIGFLME